MAARDAVLHLAERYEPQRPINDLIVELNRLYHDYEARTYDSYHPEINAQLQPIWQQMVQIASGLQPDKTFRVLDFGCGTGFEASQLLAHLQQGTITQLVCYDPSPQMLGRCRLRIGSLAPQASFTTELADIERPDNAFNLVITNSLLHHLPDPLQTIMGLVPWLAPGAIWLSGHEPSKRFYRNSDCDRTYKVYLAEKRWRKYLSPGRYYRRLKTVPFGGSPARRTAIAAVNAGLFKKRPPASLIVRLVDFHVPSSAEETESGRGFDFESMQQTLADSWALRWIQTYSFMGPEYEGRLPRRWSRSCQNLAVRFPLDGANFCSVWQRL